MSTADKSLLIYIGNQLAPTGGNPTPVDVLGALLPDIIPVVSGSAKKNKLLRLLDMWWLIISNCSKAKIVLIDTYSSSNFYYALTCAFWCKLFSIPYIPFLHGGDLESRLINNPKLSRYLFGGAKINISPSKFLFDAFSKNNFLVKIIPNTLDLNLYPFKERYKCKPRLLWVRAFHKIYNPLMALEVLRILQTDYPETTLCMVGPDKDGSMEHFKDVIKEKKIANVAIAGQLPKKEWITLAGEFDFFINTTTVDNMPVSITEAMALGLCIVSTNVGGIPSLISNGKNGILVANSDANAMASAIKYLLENSNKAQDMSNASRKQAESYNWQTVKTHWQEVLFN